jgi:hypothetical protein
LAYSAAFLVAWDTCDDKALHQVPFAFVAAP